MNKPTKPNITIPKSFAANGEKNDFNDDMLLNGFDRIKQEVVPGDALNKFIDDSYQGLNYSMDGVDDLYKGIVLYSATETYNTTSLVFNISEAGIKLYHSLVNNNKGNSLADATKWEEVSLGGGLPIGFIFWGSYSEDYVPENALYCGDGTELSGAEGQMFHDLYTKKLLTGELDTCSYSEYETEVTMTGSCWKWAVDTANEKFRIPFIPDKVLVDVADTIGVRGNGIALGITDGTTNQGMRFRKTPDYLYLTSAVDLYGQSVGTTSGSSSTLIDKSGIGLVPDASKSGAEADAANAKTYKKIRHYVVVATGSINQNEADWSEFASSLASKANNDLSNCTRPYVIETSDKSLLPSWYRVWSDGWCEQGGFFPSSVNNNNCTATFLKPFKDTNYDLQITSVSAEGYGYTTNKTSTSAKMMVTGGNKDRNWQASGYIA